MSEAGMYKRHSLESPLLAGFRKYLCNLSLSKYKQQVENVARYLYFMDSKKPSLEFVKNMEKTNDYLARLKELGNTHQTIFSYLKSIRRFLYYILNATNLHSTEKKMHKLATTFYNMLGAQLRPLSKEISKEIISKKEKVFHAGVPEPETLQAILKVAAPCFTEAIKKAEAGAGLKEKDMLMILNYLQCIMVLGKFHRPGAAQNMAVDEWKNRSYQDGFAAISIKKHKTASTQLATLVLTPEEERWFEIYFDKVRPKMLKGDKDVPEFLVSTSGEKIYNVSSDIRRFQLKFGLKPATSQAVRRAAESYVALNCTSHTDKQLFAKYMAHSEGTAEAVYREKHKKGAIMATLLVAKVREEQQQASTSKAAMEEEAMIRKHKEMDQNKENQPPPPSSSSSSSPPPSSSSSPPPSSSSSSPPPPSSSPPPPPPPSSRPPPPSSSRPPPPSSSSSSSSSPTPPPVAEEKSKEQHFKDFYEKYPPLAEKDTLSLKVCLAESKTYGHQIYDRWRKHQNRLRVDYIIGLLQDHRPTEEEAKRCLVNQAWKQNQPRVKDILEQWKKK